jgi:perosamine synthetase
MGLVQLRRLESLNTKRKSNAEFLSKGLSDLDWLEVPYVMPGVEHVWHQFTIKVQRSHRDELFKHLNSSGVGARIYYPTPVHLQPAYKSLGYEEGLCPEAESVAKQVISLPVHPGLSRKDLEDIIEAVRKFR